MFGTNEINQIYTTFQAYLPPNHLYLVHHPNTAPTNNFWSIPLFYSCRSIQIVYPQQQSNLPTAHQIPLTIQPNYQQYTRKCLTKKAHRQIKKRKHDVRKEIESAKKNSESNIVNQFYSFFSNYQKSERIVQKSIQLLHKNFTQINKIKNLFYNIIRLINFKRGRKYINRDSILNFCTPEKLKREISIIEQRLEELGLINIEEFCYLLRVITAQFIRNVSITAILSSKRITAIAKREHLRRRRIILDSIQSRVQ